ncbi:tumor necrosis factor receptor superfamily member 14-like [Thunnus maccoyii]|uniref:tumor necrosis factor receptor superfamily member 14-like n=1 Tax=Thunnus maccoyii TaxID=8240 RepID=UPI001C4D3CB3|nr:tumor necrosis factor receptor superfamily member 14-like [Thunnus maccoyii]
MERHKALKHTLEETLQGPLPAAGTEKTLDLAEVQIPAFTSKDLHCLHLNVCSRRPKTDEICVLACKGSGLQIKTSCTSTSNTVCQPLEGFYCMDSTEDGCVKALKHTSCQPGQCIRQKGTALRDTECTDCSDGTFSDGTFTSCQPHTQCESLKPRLIKPGTDSADAECGKEKLNVTAMVIGGTLLLFLLIGIPLSVYFRKKKSGNWRGHVREAKQMLNSISLTQ